MAKKGEARENITLKCTVCNEKNYRTPKNKRNKPRKYEKNYSKKSFYFKQKGF